MKPRSQERWKSGSSGRRKSDSGTMRGKRVGLPRNAKPVRVPAANRQQHRQLNQSLLIKVGFIIAQLIPEGNTVGWWIGIANDVFVAGSNPRKCVPILGRVRSHTNKQHEARYA